jgi:hypothetical protein
VEDPKFENETMAMLVHHKHFTGFASHNSNFGQIISSPIFMAVSDKNIGPRFVNIIFVVATIDAPDFT